MAPLAEWAYVLTRGILLDNAGENQVGYLKYPPQARILDAIYESQRTGYEVRLA